jgi:hypothetical protein
MSQEYYMPRPVAPNEDWIARLLTISLWVSVAGLIMYGLFAYAFDDIAIIPESVQSVLVVIGSALIVAGAELNTPPTIVAIWRKIGRGQWNYFDLVICGLSLLGAIASILIVFSIRQPLLGETGWRSWAIAIGPLVLGVTVVIDYFGCAAELGLLRSEYDESMREWLTAKAEWDESHSIEPPVIEDTPIVGDKLSPEQAKSAILERWKQPDPPTYAEFAPVVGRSASMVGAYVRELRESGKLNGQGRHN